MLFDDTYKTLGQQGEGIFRDKGSKFLGFAFPVRTEEDVKIHLASIRSLHPKARHYCWAVRFTTDRSIFKLNDDGEPSGSAARPILNTLLSFDVTNVLIIVVRYFGGTLLGIPGLIHAYKNAAIEALNNAVIINKSLIDVYRFEFGYIDVNSVMRIIKDFEINILNQEFDNDCAMELEIRKGNLDNVLGKMGKINNLKMTYLYSY
ncbi:IMPACT family protein [Arcticibacter eurypsychrophilus]|uniref:IMPACT family protein n=1 Tax=Arcticibacter eurypsychrophilus TaxID=1434752 RepID=UPI00084D8324|nr:YigZ family protein [Arcticibacter eurypsychrophilus]